MGSLSDFAENKLLNHIFNVAYTPTATVYLALCTADPTDAATGASMSEVANANSYARAAITFGAASARRSTQNAVCTFPQASGAWGTITYWALVDSGTYGSGNVLASGAFSASFAPISGNTPSVASGQVYVEITASAGGAGFTTWCVHKMLDLMLTNTAWATPKDTIYLTLLNVDTSDAATLTTGLTEVAGTAYARTKVNPNGGSSPAWSMSTTGAVDIGADVTFPTVGAGGWTAIAAVAVVDIASGSGNTLAYDNNTTAQTPTANDVVKFTSGGFDISLA